MAFKNIKLNLTHHNTSVSSSDYGCFIVITDVVVTSKLV